MPSSNLCSRAVCFKNSVANQQPKHWKDHMFTLLQCIIWNISIQMSFSSWNPGISSTIKNHSGFSVQSGTWQALDWWDFGGFLESTLYNEPARETLVAYFYYSIHCIKCRDFDTMASYLGPQIYKLMHRSCPGLVCVCVLCILGLGPGTSGALVVWPLSQKVLSAVYSVLPKIPSHRNPSYVCWYLMRHLGCQK